MAKAVAVNRKQMKLLTTFSLRLVAVPRVRLRDVFDMERRTRDGAGTLENVELVVGDSFEKCGRAGWAGACSKVIGDSAENFKHGSDGKRIEIAACGFCAADVPTAEHGSFTVVVLVNLAATSAVGFRMIDVLKPNRLVSAFDAGNREIAMSASQCAEIDLSNFKGCHDQARASF